MWALTAYFYTCICMGRGRGAATGKGGGRPRGLLDPPSPRRPLIRLCSRGPMVDIGPCFPPFGRHLCAQTAKGDTAELDQKGSLLGTVTIFSGQSEVTLWAAPALGPERLVDASTWAPTKGSRATEQPAAHAWPAGSSWFPPWFQEWIDVDSQGHGGLGVSAGRRIRARSRRWRRGKRRCAGAEVAGKADGAVAVAAPPCTVPASAPLLVVQQEVKC